MTNNGYYLHLDTNRQEDEIPAWKELDFVIRKWAALSGFEKDQEMYQKLKESQDLA